MCARPVPWPNNRHLPPSCRTRFEFVNSTPMTTKPKHAASTETAAGSDRFDVAVLRDLAGEKVFARGVDYHEDGHVEIVTFDEARVLASVEGSEVYRCELVGSGTAF